MAFKPASMIVSRRRCCSSSPGCGPTLDGVADAMIDSSPRPRPPWRAFGFVIDEQGYPYTARIDIDELYTVDPSEFVARRNALAKELRAAGDRDAAAEVSKLRRPTVVAAALNQLARRNPAGL